VGERAYRGSRIEDHSTTVVQEWLQMLEQFHKLRNGADQANGALDKKDGIERAVSELEDVTEPRIVYAPRPHQIDAPRLAIERRYGETSLLEKERVSAGAGAHVQHTSLACSECGLL
jgi:hypothetical protein